MSEINISNTIKPEMKNLLNWFQLLSEAETKSLAAKGTFPKREPTRLAQ